MQQKSSLSSFQSLAPGLYCAKTLGIKKLSFFSGFNYDNKQWPGVVCWELDTQKRFDARKESLERRSESEC